MKKITLLSILTIFLTFISCGGDAIPIPITFVFDQPQPEGKYPSYFKEITEPFLATQCRVDYLLKPINVTRIDIKKTPVETNAWYFEQMGDNTVEFSKNWLSQYYKDSLVLKHLTLPSKRTVNDNAIDGYLNKDDILTLIYSEESDQEFYNEAPIYANPKEVTNKIREVLCGSIYKEVVVIVNPSKLVSQSAGIIGGSEDQPTDISYKNPCNQPTTNGALNLNDAITEIINTNKSLVKRLNEAEEIWAKYCHPNAYVALFKHKDHESIDVWDPGSGKNYFTNRLAILESIVSTSIFRIELASDGRISGIHIIECQNANELL